MLQKPVAIYVVQKLLFNRISGNCQERKTIGSKAGNKRLKAENNQNRVLGLQVTTFRGTIRVPWSHALHTQLLIPLLLW